MEIKIKLDPVQKIIKNHGIDRNGKVQYFLTETVSRHLSRYMPFLTGTTVNVLKRVTSPTTIEVDAPYARYLYYGKRMVNEKTGKGPYFIKGVGYRFPKGATLIPTEEPISYTKAKNPLAGPFWDRRMMAAESRVIAKEVTEYARRFKK